MNEPAFDAPFWLPGSHLQTIWPHLFMRGHAGPAPTWRRERWTTPDGDFIDADWLDVDAPGSTTQPLLVLFHGLEGSSSGRYALAFGEWALRHGWHMVVPHFRGCSGEPNLSPRAYHSGDHAEIGWMLAQAQSRHAGPMAAVGISLGGNALMRWAEEAGAQARSLVGSVAAVCSPLDLTASGEAIGRGLSRWTYTPMFLRTMKTKALAQWQRHPGLFDADAVRRARTLRDFDDAYTAPLHGFADVSDYWQRASAKPHLREVQVPALLLNPLNDPFVPAASLPQPRDVSTHVTLWQPRHGGHVGFAVGHSPGHAMGLPDAVMAWMQHRL